MPHRALDPTGMPVMGTPNYTHAMLASGVSEWLHISGQVGVLPDGRTASGIEAQCRAAFDNIGCLLVDAGMSPQHVVHLRIYLLSRDDIPALRQARAEFFGSNAVVPSTLVLVCGLVDPAWLVELEIVAAR